MKDISIHFVEAVARFVTGAIVTACGVVLVGASVAFCRLTGIEQDDFIVPFFFFILTVGIWINVTYQLRRNESATAILFREFGKKIARKED